VKGNGRRKLFQCGFGVDAAVIVAAWKRKEKEENGKIIR